MAKLLQMTKFNADRSDNKRWEKDQGAGMWKAEICLVKPGKQKITSRCYQSGNNLRPRTSNWDAMIQRTPGVGWWNQNQGRRLSYRKSIGSRSSSLTKYTRKWSSTRRIREYKRGQRSEASNARPGNQSNAFKDSIGLEIQKDQEDLVTKDQVLYSPV